MGSYNALLKSSLPEEFKYYKAEEESFESSHDVFRSAFPRGFAWEVISVYSGPPQIAFKFRHWGFFEGPFKGHAPTGEIAQFYGLAILKVRIYMLTSVSVYHISLYLALVPLSITFSLKINYLFIYHKSHLNIYFKGEIFVGYPAKKISVVGKLN